METQEQAQQAKIRTMSLPVKLDEGELALRAQELATAESKLGDAETRLNDFVEAAKGTKKQIESDISEARWAVKTIARVVRERQENREVPILEEPDYDRGAIDTIRTDTNEVVATRGMTQEERQRSLFEEKRKAKKS